MTRTRANCAAALATLLVAATTGCSLLASDPEATVTLILPTKVATGQKVTAEGIYSEEAPGLEVALTAEGDNVPLATATTSDTGQYTLTFTPRDSGPQEYVVTVFDGDSDPVSKARTLTVLARTAVAAKLSGAGEADLNDKRSLKGRVEPVDESRDVILEASVDGKAWESTDIAATTNSKGAFTLRLSTAAVGARFFRAKVTETDFSAEASTPKFYLAVYDYAAAGRKYESCVAETNQQRGEFQQLEGFEVFKAWSAQMAQRLTAEARCLRNYDWPPSVASDVETIAANSDIDADICNQMASADTLAELLDLTYTFTKDVASATRVRARLGLPKRPVI